MAWLCVRLSLWLLIPFGSVVLAHEEVVFEQYTLQSSAEAEVINDLMIVHLQVQHEDRDAAVLAEKVNSEMTWALDQLKAFNLVESETRNYTTHPRYEQKRVVGWRSSQTLLVKGTDFEQVKEALQILQARLQIKRMQFLPRDETRKQIEDGLIQQALANFRHRATILQQSMGASSYRVVKININTGDRSGRVRLETHTGALARSVDTAPAIDAGQSKVTVGISGQIQLQ